MKPTSALHLAEQGVAVVLLEARAIGFGGSGRNAGLVNAGVWKNPAHVVAELGAAAGERFNLALRDSPALVFELVERYDMQCDASRCSTVNMAHNARAMTNLEDRCRQIQQLGSPVELIDGETSASLSASPVYRHGGIVDPAAGTIHPLNFARSLARAARELGASLYVDSAMSSLERRRDRWRATTAGGQVEVDQVIINNNVAKPTNKRALFIRFSLLYPSESVKKIDRLPIY